MDIQSKDLLLIVIGVLVGLPPSIAISHYYFKRSFSKGLTPYLMFHASPMLGMAPMVRNALSIEFKDREVNNLIEAQFVVINDGEKAIRDIIEPLSLRWPDSIRILDVSVVQQSPVNLEVQTNSNLTDEPPSVNFCFKLLNSREWFIVKVVADGPSNADQWEWSIVCDELPRKLPLRRLRLEDLNDLPVPTKERLATAGLSAAAAVLAWGGFSLLPVLEGWRKSSSEPGSTLSWTLGLGQVIVSILLLVLGVLAAGFGARAVRGIRPIRRSLPDLPADVVADVWRGHSAQADVVDRLKKANKT